MSKKDYFHFIKKETKAHRDFFRITMHMNLNQFSSLGKADSNWEKTLNKFFTDNTCATKKAI